MSRIKDFRLWVMCLLTIISTAVFGVSVHGALGAPGVAGEPLSPGVTIQSPYGAFTGFTDTQQKG